MLAMGSFRAAAFFRPVFNSFSSRSNSQCSAPATLVAPVGNRCSSSSDDLAVVERAKDQAAAVRAEVAGEIMSGHKKMSPAV